MNCILRSAKVSGFCCSEYKAAILATRWWARNVEMPAVDPGGGREGGSGPWLGHDSGHRNGHAHWLQTTELHLSEDENSKNSGSKKRKWDNDNSDAGGHELEQPMSRRPRGRPPGSKNKVKHPMIVHKESASCLKAHILEIANGCDVAESLATFARRRQRAVCILSGSGTVHNVTLRQPGTAGTIVNLEGRFEMLSLSGSFLPTVEPSGSTGLTIYLVGGQGQVVGGSVVGALMASGPIVVIAAIFCDAPFEQLPLDNDEELMSLQLHPPQGLSQSPTLAPAGAQQMPDPSTMALFSIPPNLLSNGQLPHDLYAWAQDTRMPY